ncbi:sensor histidine kinase [Pseudoclavibacter terrae]|uniref:sensor histidine kinase n=1 Tax=Pseudoclavibacter terrae TaxID=1530195 RepID=UPI00232AE2EF|nr:HAMP domain-containing sensor histidine kinase [Pseudoclavibacter terrae]
MTLRGGAVDGSAAPAWAPAPPSSVGQGGHAEAATPQGRAPMTLRRRLVLGLVATLVTVTAVIGAVSVSLLHNVLVDRLDQQLLSASDRGREGASGPGDTGGPLSLTPNATFVLKLPGQAEGTVGAVIDGGEVISAGALDSLGEVVLISPSTAESLASVPLDGRAHTVTVDGIGEVRAQASEGPAGYGVVIALPLGDVNATTTTLSLMIGLIGLLGIALAALFTSRWIRASMAPLERVEHLATSISKLPLTSGDAALDVRVDPRDADPRTEVGRMGQAFNTMLGHISRAFTAREASEAKMRQFVADASHELRTPLASIRGYSELTRRSRADLPEDTARALERIDSESVRMTALVEELLLLARLDEGVEATRGRVDLSLIALETVGDAHAAWPDHHWNLDIPGEPIEVVGVEGQLRRVVSNLLANADAHTPAGTNVTLTLGVDGGFAVLSVLDDGPGIDPAVLDHLFERFVRGDTSRARGETESSDIPVTRGTGLGLSIVKSVVDAHGGAIAVDSRPGATRFTVRLPQGLPVQG